MQMALLKINAQDLCAIGLIQRFLRKTTLLSTTFTSFYILLKSREKKNLKVNRMPDN